MRKRSFANGALTRKRAPFRAGGKPKQYTMPWYTDFFTALPQQAWKEAQSEEATQQELELLVETLAFGPHDRLLDVFCGYGRHALPLARMGANVTGVDISAVAIADLRASVGRKKLALNALVANFMILDPALIGGAESFGAAYCLGNSLCFFDRTDMLAFLRRIAGLLAPGGRFLAQSGMVAESFLPDFQERAWLDAGPDIQVLIQNDYDPLTARVTQKIRYYRQGENNSTEVNDRTAHYYVYTVAELLSLFREAGLMPVDTYGTPTGESYQVGDEGIWILAQKK